MRLGKLTNEDLERIILSAIAPRRDDVVLRPGIGMDCGGIRVGGEVCVLSTDPITGAAESAGRLAVLISCNDVAAAGAEPVGVLLTVMAPPDVRPEALRRVVKDAQAAAAEAGVEIIGGHTEVTDAVRRMVLSATVVGRAPAGRVFSAAGARPGDEIVMTKWAGIEGTVILASDFPHLLEGALDAGEMEEARRLRESVSVVPEGRAAAALPVTAMHDVTEGGVLGALWEMARASGCGLFIEREKVPILPVTRKICARLALDPLRLISSGSMLMTASDGAAVVEGLAGARVPAAVIGRMTKSGLIMAGPDGEAPIEAPESDELYRILG